jgi:hypothetical protein
LVLRTFRSTPPLISEDTAMTGEDSYAYNRASAAGPNRALLVVALVLWLGLMAGALVAREPATAQLEGVVVAKETGQPIAEANVAAHGEGWEWQEEVETDAQGRFRLENIGTGRAYISGYTHIHKSLKDMRIEVKEGSGNRVRLELDPVPPYLHLQTHQHTLLPDEKAVLTCKGFFPADTVRLEVRRITLPDLIEGNEDSSPGDDGVTVPPGKGELVQSKEIAAQPRDPAGSTRSGCAREVRGQGQCSPFPGWVSSPSRITAASWHTRSTWRRTGRCRARWQRSIMAPR